MLPAAPTVSWASGSAEGLDELPSLERRTSPAATSARALPNEGVVGAGFAVEKSWRLPSAESPRGSCSDEPGPTPSLIGLKQWASLTEAWSPAAPAAVMVDSAREWLSSKVGVRPALLPPPPAGSLTIVEVLNHPLVVRASPLLSVVVNDDSAQALRPVDPSKLFAYLQSVSHAVESSVRPNTLKKDRQGWRLWMEYTADMGTSAVRDDDPARAPREAFLVAAFIIWLQSKLKSSIVGRTYCKGATYMGLCYAVKRNHVRYGKRFECLSMAKAVLKTLNTEYARREGPECLVPARKEPISRAMLRQIQRAPDGLDLHNRTVPKLQWGSWFGHNLAAMLCVAASGGFRKAELCLDDAMEFDAMHMSRASLFWIIKGVVVRCPSVGQLRSLQEGDMAGLLACPAKNDPWGCSFLPHPLFFNFIGGVPDGTAARLRDMVLRCPVEPTLMRSTPLFSLGPGSGRSAKPLRHSCMNAVLKALLRTFLDAVSARRYSWHSFRVGLACSLLAAGAPEAVILALCRWRSPESLRIYARLNCTVSAEWLDNAAGQSLNSVQGPSLPHFGNAAAAATAALTQAAQGLRTADPRSAIPGALVPHVYELLAQIEANDTGLSAAQLLELYPRSPEIDADRFINDLSVEAERHAEEEASVEEDDAVEWS
jgi:hypothetical protein